MRDDQEENENEVSPLSSRLRSLSLMVRDLLLYPDHLKMDEFFLLKMEYLSAELDRFNQDYENAQKNQISR